MDCSIVMWVVIAGMFGMGCICVLAWLEGK